MGLAEGEIALVTAGASFLKSFLKYL